MAKLSVKERLAKRRLDAYNKRMRQAMRDLMMSNQGGRKKKETDGRTVDVIQ